MKFRLKKDIHATVRENLSAYVDGEADGQTVALIESHLATCDACAWEKETLEQARRLAMQVPRAAAPRSFVLRQADVEAAARTKRSQTSKMLYMRGVTALAGVFLFAVVAGDAWLRPGMVASPAPEMSPSAWVETRSPELMGKDLEPLQFAPEGTPLPVEALPPSAGEAASPEAAEVGQEDAGLRGTAPVEGTSEGVLPEPGEVRAQWWENLWLWRAAEGVLGLLFVTLLAIAITGARRVRQGI